jgi:hypothetical protein
MSDPTAKMKSKKGNQMANYNVARYNELMRIAKSDEFMSETEFNELVGIMKIRGYH